MHRSSRPRAVADGGNGGCFRQAVRDQPNGDLRNVRHPHVDDESGVGVGEALPVDIEFHVVAAMPGHEAHAGREAAVGQRHPERRGATGRRRDARHDFEAQTVRNQMFGFLAAATEEIRIAALEPDHGPPTFRQADQQRVDLRLRHRMASRLFADADPCGSGRDQGEDRGRDEPVVDDDVGLVQKSARLDRQQIGIAGAGPDEIDDPLPCHHDVARTVFRPGPIDIPAAFCFETD